MDDIGAGGGPEEQNYQAKAHSKLSDHYLFSDHPENSRTGYNYDETGN